jgi:hypothetical protein
MEGEGAGGEEPAEEELWWPEECQTVVAATSTGERRFWFGGEGGVGEK